MSPAVALFRVFGLGWSRVYGKRYLAIKKFFDFRVCTQRTRALAKRLGCCFNGGGWGGTQNCEDGDECVP